ncbi:hypothetical protein BC939DRAFT_324075 [Gamsiella multidivaricata]|uniref:uncharacterized protein n=1 Tax=Gamsiella multidivaricata TaxID=101098 RepID=UPI00221E62C4|nr:uncharacterized protein BC939DRAFT_324075 [Gamsiella multidivaricata]KAI7829875.1 hypothetical protein BC939DRAFT_324075 [Gamsiella multidivaricata]
MFCEPLSYFFVDGASSNAIPATTLIPPYLFSNRGQDPSSWPSLLLMSRRDIAEILERLSLDHRTSLAEKACAYLQAVDSNGGIKNHSSHAAICVDIAAEQLSIEVSRQALIRLSGAASPSAYSSTLEALSRYLTGKSKHNNTHSTRSASQPSTQLHLSGNSRHAQMQQLLSSTSQTYLRQMAVQYGSMELEELVLELLELFFESWIKTLAPAQRIHVKYSDAKWVGAGFWLCAMARNMTAGKAEEKATTVKRIGGRGGKELKDLILTAVEHKVKKTELDNTIRLMEDTCQEFLLSLRKPKGGNASAPSTPRKRKDSNNSDSGASLVDIVIPMRGGVDVQTTATNTDMQESGVKEGDNPFLVNKSAPTSLRRPREETQDLSIYGRLGTKRQISNVSQMSLLSDGDDLEQDQAGEAIVTTGRVVKPPSKRKKLDSQDVQLSSAGIMSAKKGAAPKKGLKEAAASSQEASRLLNQRRKTGVYNMIPRVRYENTRAFAQYQEWRDRILNMLGSTG